jgi:hypothetical protein
MGVQHTPNPHVPVSQSLSAVQAAPAPSLHEPAMQLKPFAVSQSVSAVQLVLHTPAAHK